MIRVTIMNRNAQVVALSPVTRGAVGIPVHFNFSDDWMQEGITRLACFMVPEIDTVYSIMLDETNDCEVPWELLTTEGRMLFAGAYGENGEGTLVIPTVWGEVGIIQEGTGSGDSPEDPTPSQWEQIRALAQESADLAEHQPIIQDNYWYLWDAETKEYVNSNVKAQGLDGPIGPQGPQGPQGPKGEQGEIGPGFNIIGTVASVDLLPSGMPAGVFYNVGTQPPYTIYLFDGTSWVSQGQLQGPSGEDGISPGVTIATISGGHSVTVTDADHPTGQTFNVMNGQDGQAGQDGAKGDKGDTGDAGYVWIRYAGEEPTQDSDMGTTPDNWIGIYSGTSSTAPVHYTEYNWFQIKGEKGDTGNPGVIQSVNGKSGTAVTLDAGDLEYDSSETYTSGTVGDELNSQRNTLNSVENGLAIINSGNTATQNISAGAYVWVKNNTNGISDGLYQNQGSIQISSGSTLAVGTGDGYITLVSDLLTTIYNSLNAIETYEFDAGSAYSTYFASGSNVTFKKVGRIVSVAARIITNASMPIGSYTFAGDYTVPANMRPKNEVGFYIARADSGSQGIGTLSILQTGSMKYGVNIAGVSGVVILGTGLYIV